MSAGVRNWAELLPELLGSITERLEAMDYLSFGAVCSSWAAAADWSCDLPNRPRGMPFLLRLGLDGESCALANIHNPCSCTIGPVPEMRDKWFVGSQDGWLAVVDMYYEVSLLNPLTCARIQLPSITTIPGVEPVYNPGGSIEEFITDIPDYTLSGYMNSFWRIVISSRPTADSYTAGAIFSNYNHVIIATAASGKWTVLGHSMIRDIIYCHDKFLLLSINDGLWTIDTTTPCPEMKMIAEGLPGIFINHKFLVDSSGDLLLVKKNDDPNHYRESEITSFKIMKFDPYQAAWVTLKSLGDKSLFLGRSNSISLSVREFPMLKPNCIYFTLWEWGFGNIGVFNMEDGSLDRPSDAPLNWPPPLWFTPSLL